MHSIESLLCNILQQLFTTTRLTENTTNIKHCENTPSMSTISETEF